MEENKKYFKLNETLPTENGIYKITNIKNNKFYVGSAVNFKIRFQSHLNKLKRDSHPNKYLQNTYNKYGLNIFAVEIIELVKNENELLKREQNYLDQFYDDQEMCYNLCPTAGSALGRKHSNETKKKISEAHFGKIVSLETKEKMSLAKKLNITRHFKCGADNPMSNIGEKHHMFGKKHSKQTLEKMSVSQIKNRSKEVHQYDLMGNYIAGFKNIFVAEKATAVGHNKIRVAIYGETKSGGGFLWSFDKQDKINAYKVVNYDNFKGKNHTKETKSKISINHPRSKSILCYNLDGTFVRRFNSINEAVKSSYGNYRNIIKCCKLNIGDGKYIWKFEGKK